MNIQDAYTQWAATYDQDRNLTRDLDRRVTREVLASLHGGTILEIGCGTGKNTAFLAQIGRRVLALDFSPGMIRRATGKVQAPHVAFAVADVAKRWPCAERAVDFVVCNLRAQETIEIPAFVHHLSEYVNTAVSQGFSLLQFNEWWHDADPDGPPRLASFLLGKVESEQD